MSTACLGSSRECASYMHAMIEAGYVGATSLSTPPDFVPFMVCPVCGYVFESEEATDG